MEDKMMNFETKMISFVAREFRNWFGRLLWLILILSAIGGAFIGNLARIGVLGFIVGLVLGFVTIVICGGLVATFLQIDDNLKILIKLQGGQPMDNSKAPLGPGLKAPDFFGKKPE
jgi:hypothetical protein